MHQLPFLLEILLAVAGLVFLPYAFVLASQAGASGRFSVLLALVVVASVVLFRVRYGEFPLFHLSLGEEVLTEGFDSNVRGWGTGESTTGGAVARVESSALQVQALDEPHIELVPGQSFFDFAVAADFRRIRSPTRNVETGIGFVFRRRSEDDYLGFLIAGSQYSLFSASGGVGGGGEWRRTGFLRPGFDVNRIMVISLGARVAVFINDELVHHEFNDAFLPAQRDQLGFMVSEGSSVLIDNVEIRRVSEGSELAARMPPESQLSRPFLR